MKVHGPTRVPNPALDGFTDNQERLSFNSAEFYITSSSDDGHDIVNLRQAEGSQGPQGDQGAQGAQGAQGDQGDQGVQGESAATDFYLLVESIGVHIETPALKDYILDESAAYDYVLTSNTGRVKSGDATGGFYINQVGVGGLDPVPFYSNPGTFTATSNTLVSEGDRLTLCVFQNNSSSDLSFTLKTRRH